MMCTYIKDNWIHYPSNKSALFMKGIRNGGLFAGSRRCTPAVNVVTKPPESLFYNKFEHFTHVYGIFVDIILM